MSQVSEIMEILDGDQVPSVLVSSLQTDPITNEDY